jgi:hypothetical protein
VVSRKTVPEGGRLPPVEIRRMAVDGGKARIRMVGGIIGGPTDVHSLVLVKQGGEWRIDNPVSGPSAALD